MFSSSAKADLSDVEKDVAINNVRRLARIPERIMERFETSPNFHLISFDNHWVNHPDEYYVEPGVFKNLFKNFFGDIRLEHFLTQYKFDDDNNVKLKNFCNACDFLFLKLSYDEVECACNQLLNLYTLLCHL